MGWGNGAVHIGTLVNVTKTETSATDSKLSVQPETKRVFRRRVPSGLIWVLYVSSFCLIFPLSLLKKSFKMDQKPKPNS